MIDINNVHPKNIIIPYTMPQLFVSLEYHAKYFSNHHMHDKLHTNKSASGG